MFIVSSAACFLWGAAATYCFFNAWLALLGVIAGIIGFMRRQVTAATFLKLLYAQVTIGAVHGLSLSLLFAICWQRLQLGRTRNEIVFFMVAAVGVMACQLPTISRRIEQIWRSTNPGDHDNGPD